jgi:hypothetical protein
MSFHVYISREGFKENPVPDSEWRLAIEKCDELIYQERKNKKGNWKAAILRTDRRQHLNVSPYGLMFAQTPSKDLVQSMFKISAALNAAVYSERLKPYDSVADWERRTKKFRDKRELRNKAYKRHFFKRKPFWLMVIIILGLLFWVIHD